MKTQLLIQRFKDKQWRKKFIRYWVKDPFWGSLDYLTHYGLRYMPISLNAKVGQCLGYLAGKYRFKAVDERVKQNLAILRPDLDEAERDKIQVKMWQSIGQSMCEYSLLDKIYAQKRITMLHKEYLQPFIDEKQAVVFVFAHTGNWELCGNYVIDFGFDVMGLYKPVRNRFARKIADIARARMGGVIKLLEANSKSMRAMCKHLANDGAVWIAIDEYKLGQVHGPRLGRDIKSQDTNMAYAVRLAQRYNASIVPIWVTREEDLSFRIDFSKPFKVSKGDEAMDNAISTIDQLLENWVIKHLEQWYMLHELRL